MGIDSLAEQALTQIYSCAFICGAMLDEYFKQRAFKQGKRVRRSMWEGVPNDCKKATGRELSIFLLPRQICLHIFLLCLRSLLRQRTAIEIFWQAALCFHFHKRCSEGMRQRKRERGRGRAGEAGARKGKGMLSEVGLWGGMWENEYRKK